MGTAVLVWYLISASAGYREASTISYSPPMPSLQECERVSEIVRKLENHDSRMSTQCVQMSVIVTK